MWIRTIHTVFLILFWKLGCPSPYNDWATTGRATNRGMIPGRTNHFSLPWNVQTGSGAHPASYSMGSGGCSPRIRRPGMNTTTHPNTVPGLRMNGVVPPPPTRLHGVYIDDFALTSISKPSDSQNGELSKDQKTRSLCSKVQKPCQWLQPLRCVFTYSLPVYSLSPLHGLKPWQTVKLSTRNVCSSDVCE